MKKPDEWYVYLQKTIKRLVEGQRVLHASLIFTKKKLILWVKKIQFYLHRQENDPRKRYIFQDTKKWYWRSFLNFYFVCWSQLPLNMLVSFRRCTKIRCCFCDRKILYTKICNACRFQWNHKDIMSGQIKDIIICLKDVKLQYYKNSQEK